METKMLDSHRGFFKDLFKLKEGDPLPPYLTQMYDRARMLADRKDVRLTDPVLLTIALLAGEVLNMSNLVASIPTNKATSKKTEPLETQTTKVKEPEPKPKSQPAIAGDETEPQRTSVKEAPRIEGVPCTAFHGGVEKSGVLLNEKAEDPATCKIIFAGFRVPTLVVTNNVKIKDSGGNWEWLNPR